jgi:hypothetical protein
MEVLQKIAHCDGDFLHVGFERKVSGIQELDSRVGVVASGGFPFVLRRLPSDDVLDLRHVAFGVRGGLLWRAPALASVHVRRVPIPPAMLGMRLLVLAVMLLRLVEEIGHGCDVHGWCSRQLPFAARKSRPDLLEQPAVPVWILKRGKRVVGTTLRIAPADARVLYALLKGAPA